MKKQVNYQGKLFDLNIDEKNNLILTESVQVIKKSFCSAYYCKSGKLKKWKVEFNKSLMLQMNKKPHINWVENEAEAQKLCTYIDNVLNELFGAVNITRRNKINKTITNKNK